MCSHCLQKVGPAGQTLIFMTVEIPQRRKTLDVIEWLAMDWSYDQS